MKRITLILVVLITQAVWAQDWARTQLAEIFAAPRVGDGEARRPLGADFYCVSRVERQESRWCC